MDKPMFLKGKAESFEQMWLEFERTGFVTESEERENIIINLPRFSELHRFLTQPFDPVIVPELFKNWHKESVDEELKSAGWLGRYSDGKNNFMWMDDLVLFLNGEPCTGITRTVNDFINDCHRNNIELEWKE